MKNVVAIGKVFKEFGPDYEVQGMVLGVNNFYVWVNDDNKLDVYLDIHANDDIVLAGDTC